MNNNCTEVCSCYANSTFECQRMVCADDASCEMRDDQYTCVCNQGFEGNGIECEPGTRKCGRIMYTLLIAYMAAILVLQHIHL